MLSVLLVVLCCCAGLLESAVTRKAADQASGEDFLMSYLSNSPEAIFGLSPNQSAQSSVQGSPNQLGGGRPPVPTAQPGGSSALGPPGQSGGSPTLGGALGGIFNSLRGGGSSPPQKAGASGGNTTLLPNQTGSGSRQGRGHDGPDVVGGQPAGVNFLQGLFGGRAAASLNASGSGSAVLPAAAVKEAADRQDTFTTNPVVDPYGPEEEESGAPEPVNATTFAEAADFFYRTPVFGPGRGPAVSSPSPLGAQAPLQRPPTISSTNAVPAFSGLEGQNPPPTGKSLQPRQETGLMDRMDAGTIQSALVAVIGLFLSKKVVLLFLGIGLVVLVWYAGSYLFGVGRNLVTGVRDRLDTVATPVENRNILPAGGGTGSAAGGGSPVGRVGSDVPEAVKAAIVAANSSLTGDRRVEPGSGAAGNQTASVLPASSNSSVSAAAAAGVGVAGGVPVVSVVPPPVPVPGREGPGAAGVSAPTTNNTVPGASVAAGNLGPPLTIPAISVGNPGASLVSPAASVINPAATVMNPGASAVNPSASVVNPAATVVNPVASAVIPTPPAMNPSATVGNPTAPAVNPVASAVNPSTIAVNPAATVGNPTIPVPAVNSAGSVLNSATTAVKPVASAANPVASAANPVASAVNPVASAVNPATFVINPLPVPPPPANLPAFAAVPGAPVLNVATNPLPPSLNTGGTPAAPSPPLVSPVSWPSSPPVTPLDTSSSSTTTTATKPGPVEQAVNRTRA